MTRNSTLLILLSLAFLSLATISCKKFEGGQTTPSFIHIDSVSVSGDYFVYGATTHKITDAWVYVDDQLVGVYELPSTFPILKKGPHKVSVYGGIKVDGRSTVRNPYPFYKPLVYERLNLVEDSIINLQPVLNYYPIGDGVNFAWSEDFENTNTLLKDLGSDTSAIRITGPEAWHSVNSYWSGKVELPPDSLDFTFIARKVDLLARDLRHPPYELSELPRLLAEKYFCNFSLFQSLPDSWGVDQVFPIMPIQRLDEEPTIETTIQDVTCDSDGKIDMFVRGGEVARTIPLHPIKKDEPYFIAVYLVGAYQEILGDLHNLFGDTNAVHIVCNDKGGYDIDKVIDGESVEDVLDYVNFSDKALVRNMENWVTRSVKEGKITLQEGKEFLNIYRSGLYGYTYLE